MPRTALDPACAGDCNRNGFVLVAELLISVNLLLAGADAAPCAAVDHDRDGRVSIDELIRAVGRTLGGCAVEG